MAHLPHNIERRVISTATTPYRGWSKAGSVYHIDGSTRHGWTARIARPHDLSDPNRVEAPTLKALGAKLYGEA